VVPATPKIPPVKRLTPAEAAERRRKNLCYNCDERWEAGHRCKQKTLFLIEGDETTAEDADDVFEDAEPAEVLEISVAALAGETTPQTMRVTLYIKRQPLTALVDSGSTHNFLHPRVMRRLLCQIDVDAVLEVRIADGGRLRSTGCCPGVLVRLQQLSFSADFYILPLGGCDMVLGAHWLRTLGPILWDFSELSMVFTVANQRYKIMGNRSQPVHGVGIRCMEQVWKKESPVSSLLIQPRWVQDTELVSITASNQPVLPQLHQLLDRFSHLFAEPTALPPQRSHDHQIPLLPDSAPTNVRPYRYAQIQKDEIERTVKALLETGLIRPSHSPYSSPVLLVRKKDGTW
jgi:hypothetical protein